MRRSHGARRLAADAAIAHIEVVGIDSALEALRALPVGRDGGGRTSQPRSRVRVPDEARTSVALLAHVLAFGVVDLDAAGVAAAAVRRGEIGGRVEIAFVERGAGRRLQDDVRARDSARVEPEIVGSREAEGELRVLARRAADVDARPGG